MSEIFQMDMPGPPDEPVMSSDADEFIIEDLNSSEDEKEPTAERSADRPLSSFVEDCFGRFDANVGRDLPCDFQADTDEVMFTSASTQAQIEHSDIDVEAVLERPLDLQPISQMIQAVLQLSLPKYVSEIAHPDSICADCFISPIKGIRYKCCVCLNHDYCSACELYHPHPMYMLKSAETILRPESAHKRVIMPEAPMQSENPQKQPSIQAKELEKQIVVLRNMGFYDQAKVTKALFKSQFNINEAANILLEQ